MKKHFLKRAASAVMALALGAGLAAPVFATEEVPLTKVYSSAEFEAEYTYTGNDLGATWTKESTIFRVWAPTATSVKLNLYRGGTAGTDDLIEQLDMEPSDNGTWVWEVLGDQNGVYYTYSVEVDGVTREACDPYARTTGVNGQRAMVIDMETTNPEGWAEDRDPHSGNPITDAVIYELHVRDLSVDESSGITNKGKFLGLIETGTTNSQGIPTGLDYIKNLGITHIHLLPSYDYGSVDETKLDENQFNWGYDPVNYNVPEGSYSTDPYNGEIRVKEFKTMVKGLHDNGISVIMDVVYNHVYDAEKFCFNQIVPQYFSRVSENGIYSAGSGCGNDTASERSMVKKYIVDSVKYWADEYHIDGFRFDLVGLIDTETINAVVEEVHKTHPNVIFYGEGWTMDTKMTKDGYTMTTQTNSTQTPGFAFFSDTMRDALRGSMSNDYEGGFISGGGGYANNVANCFMGAPIWCKSPTQTINYASCHDNLALFDRITMATRKYTFEDRVRMNNLAASVVILSQGVPFFQAGEEMLRSKPLPDGGYDHNSYKSSDEINSIKWDNLNDATYCMVRDYYKGLIEFRSVHPAFRMLTAEDVSTNMTQIREGLESNVVAFQFAPHANGEENEGIFVVINGKLRETTVNLPEGKWTIYVQGEKAGTEPLGTAEGTITVGTQSTTVLIRETEPQIPEQPTQPEDTTPNEIKPGSKLGVIIGIAAGVAAVVIAACVIFLKKSK